MENTQINSAKVNNLKQRWMVECEYKDLIDLIKDTEKKVDASCVLNQQSKDVKIRLLATLKDKLHCVESLMNRSLNDMHWDKLVISFFGETNAGKSTIIETFRVLFDKSRPQFSDGCIVGDGRSDFTKEYHEYELSIDGLPFILVDVPGIEGKEGVFMDGIRKALSRSHCVFFVHGHNKPLEAPIIEKIRSYLGDWIQVYSVYNVRGGVSDYDEPEERESLLNTRTLKIENEIKGAFRQTLGDVYKGNITLQALLAMCAKASFSQERSKLSKNQQTLIKFFGSAEGVLQYSQFQTLINQIQQKSKNFTDEISSANMLKVRSLKNEVVKELESIAADAGFEQYKARLELFESDLKKIASELNRNLESRINSLVCQKFDSTAQLVNSILASKEENKKESLQNCVSKLSDEIQSGIQSIMDDCSKSWNEYVARKSSDFDGFDNLSLQFPQLQKKGGLKIDFSDAIKKLDVGLGDVGGFVAAVGVGARAGSFGGPLVIAIGGIGFGVSYLVKKELYDDGGVSDAQNAAKRDLADEKERLITRLKKIVKELQSLVYGQQMKITESVQNEIRFVEEIISIVTNLKTTFNQFKLA